MPVSLPQLAAAKKLPLSYLKSLGLEDQQKAVAIPYLDASGNLLFKRRRVKLAGGRHTMQPAGVPLQVYGQWRLEEARELGYVVCVEGESDCWTLWHHDYPALGVPGANCARVLESSHFQGVKEVYLWQEPGAAGQSFVDGCAERLAALGWEGDLYLCRSDIAKDPSALFLAAPRLFSASFDRIMAEGTPRELPPPAPAVHVNGSERQSHDGFSDELKISIPRWPAPLAKPAFHGLAGEIAQAIDPFTEADQAAVLLSFLTAFGCACGRYSFYPHEASRHYPNLYLVLVGRSALSRKGTSWAWVRSLFDAMTAPGFPDRCVTGLSSSEGLVEAVGDPVYKVERNKGKDGTYSEETVLVDPGVTDKRLLVVEEEWSSVLRQMDRQGNTLSQYLRTFWDSGRAGHVRRNSPRKATDAHVALIGHITVHELQATFRQLSITNGTANRIAWCCCRRSKEIPRSTGEPDLAYLKTCLSERLESVVKGREVTFDARAAELWDASYKDLTQERPGALGDLLSRAAPQVCRLALIYALLDGARHIEGPHLEAALAVWTYCQNSVEFIFKKGMGDPIADEILLGLRGKKDGLSLEEIHSGIFNRHQSGTNIAQALGLLMEHGMVKEVKVPTRGRPATRYICQEPAKEAKEAKEATQ